MKLFIALILFFLAGCAHTQDISLAKLDPMLKQQVIEHKKSSSEELISFVGRSKTTIDSTLQNDIESTGIRINSILKNIFTGKGSYKSIIKLSAKDYIQSLEASKKLMPNTMD
jgi:hypothetical protein